MAFHTFGPGLALDKITMKGLSTVTAQLIDAETGDPVQAYTMDDVPAETLVTTNRYGYFPQFKVPDTTRQLQMTFGGLTLENFAWELILGAGQAAEDAAAAWAAVEAIMNQVVAIDAPAGWDADTVTGQAIHIVTGLDEALNTAPAASGSQTIVTYPFGSDALQQISFSYSTAGAEIWSRVKTSGGWSSWTRLDADKWAERLAAIETKNNSQDTAITAAKTDAIADATTKYGGLSGRIATVEASTQAIDAPVGFDANAVSAQAVHMIHTNDGAINMPGAGTWLLRTWPQGGTALLQEAILYNSASPELHTRRSFEGAWSAWVRMDANKLLSRLSGIETSTQAIDAPPGFDANTVTKQSVHMIQAADNAINIPGPGTWLMRTWPQGGTALLQEAILYNSSAPEIHTRRAFEGTWSAWIRMDADKWATRLGIIETTATQDRAAALADATTKANAARDAAAADATAKAATAESNAKAYTDQVVNTSHLASDTDGTPYYSPGSMTLRVFTDTDGVPFFFEA